MNKLQFESSPYLKQHQHNPVDWQTWSESALEEARRLNKPVLISIGYSTCHWCHVMAHESFEDVETAKIMNECFVNIKIDREERPDLDHYFMNAIQAMGISGGWPLHCFLSPEGKPFYGGTYFPPTPKYGRPSWRQILMAIHQAFQNKQTEILGQADELFQHLQLQNEIEKKNNADHKECNPVEIFNQLKSTMDTAHGGFGTHPKFPNTQGIQLLMQIYFLTGNKVALDHAIFSLSQMCLGGIYDHIEGGFSRYSVDATWDVPHFEKMLYDHAQLIQTLSLGYQYSKNPLFKRCLIQSLNFFETKMKDRSGLFYSAMDADSDGEEGSYYVWKENELKDVLGSEYQDFCKVFSWSSLDHVHTDKKVLRIKNTQRDYLQLDQELHSSIHLLNKLQSVRSERTLPSIDHKMIVCWNAMTVSAYVSWYKVSLEKEFLVKAEELLNKIFELCSRGEVELCRYRIGDQRSGFGFLEDYAYSIKALLDMYFVTLEENFMIKAMQVFELMHQEFRKENSDLYTMSSSKYKDFNMKQTDWIETTYPNPNAILSWACRYFFEYSHDHRYLSISKSLIATVRSRAQQHPLSMASWVQQIINSEMDYIVLKTAANDSAIRNLKEYHIPGLIRVKDNLASEEMVFCFGGMCHQPIHSKQEVLSLFSNYKLQFENQE